MKTIDAIKWFKTHYFSDLQTVTAGTPFTVDLIVAIAYQETGYIWSALLGKGLSEEKVLELCVSDTIDGDSARPRKAFPRRKGDLLAVPNGDKMYAIARQSLIDMSAYIPGFSKLAKNPDKFCHGYGIFQYDLQFFKEDPQFFLQRKWATIAGCVAKVLGELRTQMAALGWKSRTELSDTERVYLAIAYNTGARNTNLRGSFKQGYKSDDGRYYGENIFEFMRLAQTIAGAGGGPTPTPAPAPSPTPGPNEAPLPAPTPVDSTGEAFVVDVRQTPLRLRSEPKIPKDDPNANVVARLPDGQFVYLVSGKKTDQFIEVETDLDGAHFRGFAATEFLVAVVKPKMVGDNPPPPPTPAPAPGGTSSDIPAVSMPRKDGAAPAN